jgi:pimeloyl-ACP methyl ester carboxylesterase
LKKSIYNIIVIVLLISTLTCDAQTKVYLIHGQGSDSRLFSKLKLNDAFDTIFINLPLPQKGDNMQNYARKIIPQIDTTMPFVLIGVSLGGMVAAELNDLLHPLQTIIISSAKNRNELPSRYKFMHTLPIYRLFPAFLIKAGSFLLQPLVEPDRRKEKALFKSMLRNKDKMFLKRSIPLIVNWQKKTNDRKPLIHIHGTKDHTLPIKYITANSIIKGGSHMMVLTQAALISDEINKVLSSLKQ